MYAFYMHISKIYVIQNMPMQIYNVHDSMYMRICSHPLLHLHPLLAMQLRRNYTELANNWYTTISFVSSVKFQ
jgi:hypothetical protein